MKLSLEQFEILVCVEMGKSCGEIIGRMKAYGAVQKK